MKNQVQVKKDAENRIVENLSKEQVKEAQRSASDKMLDFNAYAVSQLTDYKLTTMNHKNEFTAKKDNLSFKLCYKSNKHLIACYKSVQSVELRDKLLKAFKNTKNVKKCSDEHYTTSATKYFRIDITFNKDDNLKVLVDEMFKATENAIRTVDKAQ